MGARPDELALPAPFDRVADAFGVFSPVFLVQVAGLNVGGAGRIGVVEQTGAKHVSTHQPCNHV